MIFDWGGASRNGRKGRKGVMLEEAGPE